MNGEDEPGTSGTESSAWEVEEGELLSVSKKRTVTNTWVEINFHWVIEQFSLKPQQNGEYIHSTDFYSERYSERDETVKWNLKVFPKGTRKYKDWVAVYLTKSGIDEDGPPVTAQF